MLGERSIEYLAEFDEGLNLYQRTYQGFIILIKNYCKQTV